MSISNNSHAGAQQLPPSVASDFDKMKLWDMDAEDIHKIVLAELEAQLIDILKLPEAPNPENNFIESGLESLQALMLRNRLSDRFGCTLPGTVAFQHPNPHALAGYLTKCLMEDRPAMGNIGSWATGPGPMPPGQHQLLSPAQYESWFHQRQNPGSCRANMPFGLRLLGPLDTELLQPCLDEIARRHAILRTRYLEREDQVWQVQESKSNMALQRLDWSNRTMAERRQAMQDWMRAQIQERPFDLSKLPLWRTYLVQIRETEHYLLFVFHHIQIDRISFHLLQDELWRLYAAFKENKTPPLPSLPIQYSDYAAWQRRMLTPERLMEKQTYWNQLLGHPPASLRLSKTEDKMPAAFSKTITRPLGRTRTRELENFSRQQGNTLFTTLVTAFSILLYPYSNRQSVLIGAPMSNKRTHRRLENLIGHFSGKASLHIRFSDKPNVVTLLQRAQRMVEDAFMRQNVTHMQLQLLSNEGEPCAPNQSFQVVINFIPVSPPPITSHSTPLLKVQYLKNMGDGVSAPELTLVVMYEQSENGNRLNLGWRYRVGSLKAEQIHQLSERFESILKDMQRNPEEHIDKLV
uniref:Phosphopantetheine attachment site n=1 Tax=Candidatus Kentrum sp. FW TaxID=2126338 RepID=A0A450S849_9GAMM|nr:MAG: Phosphopantetheine attachment site [Candidatus Kentron sp. FW]